MSNGCAVSFAVHHWCAFKYHSLVNVRCVSYFEALRSYAKSAIYQLLDIVCEVAHPGKITGFNVVQTQAMIKR